MDFVVVALIGLILTIAIIYIVKSKKNGNKCIGCPDGKKCSGSGCGSKC